MDDPVWAMKKKKNNMNNIEQQWLENMICPFFIQTKTNRIHKKYGSILSSFGFAKKNVLLQRL